MTDAKKLTPLQRAVARLAELDRRRDILERRIRRLGGRRPAAPRGLGNKKLLDADEDAFSLPLDLLPPDARPLRRSAQ